MENKKETSRYSLARMGNGASLNEFTVSLGKKSERLATAIYLVTNFLSDNEPMRTRLRDLSLVLVRLTTSVRYGVGVSEKVSFEEMQNVIAETLSLLELAFIAGLVSEMNFTILKREYGVVRDSIEVKKASRESRTDTILGDNFFGPALGTVFTQKGNPEIEKESTKPAELAQPIGHPKGHNSVVMSDRMIDKKNTTDVSVLSRTEKRHPQTVSSKNIMPPVVRTSVEKDSRRVRILKLVKDSKEVSIKDMITHFPDISEKTIQRELVSLVESGVLKRAGERRWARYAIA